MDRENAPAIIGGFLFSFTNLIGNTFVETAIKGLIGGIVGYGGKLLLSWGIKKVKQLIEKLKNKQKIR